MKRVALLLLFVALTGARLLAQGSAAGANSSKAPPSDSQNRITVTVELVNVLTTVTDKKNHLVADLTKDDFKVYEDGKPQEIRYFSRETDLPLRIGLLIDTSNSVRGRLSFEQDAAIDFLSTAIRPGKDLAFAVSFDAEPQLIQDYTDDIEKLSEAIRGLKAGGVTSLFDAIFFACKEKLLFFPPPEPYLRRVMIVVSDGQDNRSERTQDEAISMAERSEVTIFAISTNRSGAEAKGDKTLRTLAGTTGGRAFFPFEVGDLAASFQQIANELRSQYSLAYVSTNSSHDGTFRKVTIKAVNDTMHVRAKEGYFSLPR
jgi:VWFA-related protein